MTLYLAEVYVREPGTNQPGWDIDFVWVHAESLQAARERIAAELPRFDRVISISQSSFEPLCYCPATVLGAARY